LVALYKAIKSDISQWSDKDGNNWSTEIGDLDASQLNSKKLYLYYTQLGRCMYTGNPIDLHQLNDKYDIDHIYPRSLTKDDSFDNLVLVEKTANSKKSDDYPIRADVQKTHKSFWDVLRQHGLISERKYSRLIRTSELTVDDLSQFVARQLVETNQSVKAVTTILKQMYPSTEVVYVKAENVSDFRHANDFIKVRSLNNHHHAKDAYLNIVVGNVYHERFTKNFRKFIEKNGMKRSYNLTKMFDSDIMKANSKTEKVWDSKTSMDTVRKMMASNDVRVTKRLYTQTGKFWNANLSKADKVKKDVYLPSKLNNAALSDIKKYGGVTDVATSYYVLMEYTDKNQKKCFELMPIFIYQVHHFKSHQDYIDVFISNKSKPISNVKVLNDRVQFNTLIKADGFLYRVGGRSNSNFWVESAVELVVSEEWIEYIKLLEKYKNLIDNNIYVNIPSLKTGSNNMIISTDMNKKFFIYLIEKMEMSIYRYMRRNKAEELRRNGIAIFDNLSIEEQVKSLIGIMDLFTDHEKKYKLNLSGMTASMMKIAFSLSGIKSFSIYNESPTGLYSNEIKII